MNPFEMHGPEFLGFYFVLFIVALVGAIYLRSTLRLPNDEPTPDMLKLDPYEIAYLAGGADRAVNAAIACLVHRGHLKASASERKLSIADRAPSSPHALENSIYLAIGPDGEKVETVRERVSRRCDEIADKLKERDLLCNDSNALIGQALPILLMLAVAVVGVIKIYIGLSRNRPVTFLVIATVVTVIVAFAGFARRPQRSHRGDSALDQLKEDNSALEYTASQRADALAGDDFALAVGLFGMGVLSGGPLADLQFALRPPPAAVGSGSSCSSGSSCGGSSCGGGCGGGGCGGCGG